MESLALLVGHLVGDFIFQVDFIAKYKNSPKPTFEEMCDCKGDEAAIAAAERYSLRRCNAICTLHCALYGTALWLCAGIYFPLWLFAAAAVLHWPVDRFRLASKWMHVVGQAYFATGACAPWSVIVVDNTIHLVVLLILGRLAAVL